MKQIDRNILKLMEILREHGRFRFDREFCEVVDILPQNLVQVRTGDKHFTADHINKICAAYGVNANWIFGLEPTMFRKVKSVNLKVNTVNTKQAH